MLVARKYKTPVSVLGFSALLPAVCSWNTFVLMSGFPSTFESRAVLLFLCFETKLRLKNY
jgi:hypothetical protein